MILRFQIRESASPKLCGQRPHNFKYPLKIGNSFFNHFAELISIYSLE